MFSSFLRRKAFLKANPHTEVWGFALISSADESGGPEEIRTLDLSDANRTLSQLSYRPRDSDVFAVTRKALEAEVPRLFSVLVEISGIEPLTS